MWHGLPVVPEHLPPADCCTVRLQTKAALEKLPPPGFMGEYDVMWHGISLWSVWVSCPACVPASLLPTPLLLAKGQREEQRRFWYCMSTAQQQLKHWCVTNAVLVTNLKHSTIQAAMEKNNILTRPSTPGCVLLYGCSRICCCFCVLCWSVVR